MDILKIAAIAVAGYILGSINIAVIVSYLFFKGDIRDKGSHNAGSTNMARVYGFGAGILTFGGDVVKTILAMLLGRWLFGDIGFMIGGGACLIGHCWPVFFKFKGGKGVAVSAGIAFMYDWRAAIILIALFVLISVLTRYVSLGSLIAVTLFPPALLIVGGFAPVMYILPAALVIIVWAKHWPNIKRLAKGEENKFSFGHAKK